MADLGTILINGDPSNQTTDWGTYTAGDYINIDEGISSADGTEEGDDTNANADKYLYCTLQNMPSDFLSPSTISVQLRHRVTGAQTNTRTVFVRLETDEATPAALTDEVQIDGQITSTSLVNSTVTALTNPTGNKTQWDNAVIRVRLNISKSKGGDSNGYRLDTGEITGTYTESRQVSSDISNKGQTFAADVYHNREVSSALSNKGQAFQAYVFNGQPKYVLNNVITGFHVNFGCHNLGPFYYNGRYFSFGVTTNDKTISVLSAPSTDITDWTQDDGANDHENTYAVDLWDAKPFGQKVHVATLRSQSASIEVVYRRFDLSNRTWDQVNGSNRWLQLSYSATTGAGSPSGNIHLYQRDSDSELFLYYNGFEENVSGTDYARAYFNRQSGDDTWDGETSVDDGGTSDWYPQPLIENASGEIHFGYNASHNFNPGNYRYKTYTDAGGLSTEVDPTNGADAVSYGQGDYIFQSVFRGHVKGLSTFLYYDVDNDVQSSQATNLTTYSRGGPFTHAGYPYQFIWIGDSGNDGPVDVGVYAFDINTKTLSSEAVYQSPVDISDTVYQSGYSNYRQANGDLWVTITETGNSGIGNDEFAVMIVPAPTLPISRASFPAFTNKGQTFAANVSVASGPVVTADFTNSKQTFSASVDVIVTADALLSNKGQTFAADTEVEVQASSDLSNKGQIFQADVRHQAYVTADLTNAAQTFAASVDVIVTTDALLSNSAQPFAASVDVYINGDSDLVNSGQQFSAVVDVIVTADADLSNVGQIFQADILASPIVNANLTNSKQTFAASVDVVVTEDALLSNSKQTFNASVDVIATVDADLSNVGQVFQADLSAIVGRAVTADLQNSKQTFAASVDVIVTADAGLTNAGQTFAASVSPIITLDADLSNSGQVFAANVIHTPATVTADLSNSGQTFSASVDVLISVAASLSNAGQQFNADVDVEAVASFLLANSGQAFAATLFVEQVAFVDCHLNNTGQSFKCWLTQQSYYIYDAPLEIMLYAADLELEQYASELEIGTYEADVELDHYPST